jgi:hypothetical protein
MKKLMHKIKEWWVWFTSKRVKDAINSNATYEDVCNIVKEEMSR